MNKNIDGALPDNNMETKSSRELLEISIKNSIKNNREKKKYSLFIFILLVVFFQNIYIGISIVFILLLTNKIVYYDEFLEKLSNLLDRHENNYFNIR